MIYALKGLSSYQGNKYIYHSTPAHLLCLDEGFPGVFRVKGSEQVVTHKTPAELLVLEYVQFEKVILVL